MPQLIPIQAIPNQSFDITLDNNIYVIAIKTTNGVMSVSIDRNSVPIIDNLRVVAGSAVIPAIYEEAGNFMFMTGSFQLPDYTKFNITQSLVYFSAAELVVFRTAPFPPITASFFNPIADLPLRFSPQGYTQP